MNKLKRLFAVLLALALSVSLLAAAIPALADGATYYVKTASGLMTLAKKCSLDSYSKDISVQLMNDIDLTGTDFSPISIFNGEFDGNGYTISGLELTYSGSHVGLFRYIGSEGYVHDLNVRGTVTPSGTAEYVGGIVGTNIGTVSNCSFYGSVDGKSNVGGIAGSNETGGVISDCRSDGTVVCEHYTGGVVGLNMGTVRGSTNYCAVNTTGEDIDQTLEDYNLSDLNSVENVDTYTDTGGVAGFSSGVVMNCTNYGTIGYIHVGYNVGGIIGRQSGYVYGCVNNGDVMGRKEVGGIVGQMEPYLTLLFSADTTERLKTEFNKLHDLINKALVDAQSSSNTITATLDAMNGYATGAVDNLDVLGEQTIDFVDSNIDSANDVVDRIDYVMNNLPGVMTSLENATTYFTSAMKYFDMVNDDLNIVGDMKDGTYDETDYQLLSITTGTGGRVTSDKTNPAAGQTVTLTVTPTVNAGTGVAYELERIEACDADGKAVNLTKSGENTYTFTMPTLSGDPVNDPVNSVAKSVVVRASFTPTAAYTARVRLVSTYGGVISADDLEPADGAIGYTIKVTPAEGYELNSLNVTDNYGDVRITKLDNLGTRYSFDVSDSPTVQVTATFKPMSDWDVVVDAADTIDARSADLQVAMDAAGVDADALKTALGYTYDSESGQWVSGGTTDYNAAAEAAVFLAEDLTTAGAAAADVISATSTMLQVLGPYVSEAAQAANEHLGLALDDMQAASNSLTDAIGSAKQIINYLNEQPDISFSGLGSEYRANVDELINNMHGVTDSLTQLNYDISNATTTLISDLAAVNDQFNVVMLLMVDTLSTLMNAKYGDNFEDISNEDTEENTNGKVASSTNYGDVTGDINIGGVAGGMAIEYDFDPESDVTGAEESTTYVQALQSTYESMCVIRDCENRGDVWSRKDCCGCIVGYMDMGSVINCRAYGTATSESGDYVGGLAGESLSYVRDSYAMCTLSGGDYVGGGVGYGVYLTNCLTYVEITEGVEFVGAVAGCIETGGTASGNYFVSDELSGIDGISYVGIAEPMTYDAMATNVNVPEDFSTLSISFVADGQIIKTIEFAYGDSLDKSEIPAVPAKDGYYGEWPEVNFDNMTFSQTVQAEYISLNTSLASAQTREGGELPVILAEGEFHPGSSVSVEEAGEAPEVAEGQTVVEYLAVTINDPEGLPAQTHTIHYLAPEVSTGEKLFLYVKDGDAWREAKYTTEGSYLIFPANGDEFTLCVAKRDIGSLPYIIMALGAALLALIVVLLVLRSHRKKKNAARAGASAAGAGVHHISRRDARKAKKAAKSTAAAGGGPADFSDDAPADFSDDAPEEVTQTNDQN